MGFDGEEQDKGGPKFDRFLLVLCHWC